MKFQRHPGNPIIPRRAGQFYSVHSANPDILRFRDRYFLYFRGQDESGHDQIGVAFAGLDQFDGVHWQMHPGNPVIRVGPNASDFDSGYVLDPAAIVLNGKVYLYYTAHRRDWKNWNIPSHVGLAISEDGTQFDKHDANPIIVGTQPEVLRHDGLVYLFYQRLSVHGFFEFYCRHSEDGVHFARETEVKIFRPSGEKNAFDRYSISTLRIWQDETQNDAWYYMTYGGCNRYFDYPVAIGLARSRDLLHWERYPGNPILARGEPGTWDEGALWFATVMKRDGVFYLWYEGTGTGMGLATPAARAASRLCREQDYGGYAVTSFSQIGLATFAGEMPSW